MAQLNKDLDRLKEIILIYANTPPHPVENLLEIQRALLGEYFHDRTITPLTSPEDNRDLSLFHNPFYLWDSAISCSDLQDRIKLTIEIHGLGPAKAQVLFADAVQKGIDGIYNRDPYSRNPDKERHRVNFCTAFTGVFGYKNEEDMCPCNLAKMDVLAGKGFVTAGENLNDSTWVMDRLTCLQCEHIHFVSILDDLTKGSYRLLHDSGIISKYCRTITEEAQFTGRNSKTPVTITAFYQFKDNDAAFPAYLNGLPCNLLVELLSSGPYAKKLKRCPHCGKFFFAKDAKRKICYETECLLAEARTKKRRERSDNPVKYI